MHGTPSVLYLLAFTVGTVFWDEGCIPAGVQLLWCSIEERKRRMSDESNDSSFSLGKVMPSFLLAGWWIWLRSFKSLTPGWWELAAVVWEVPRVNRRSRLLEFVSWKGWKSLLAFLLPVLSIKPLKFEEKWSGGLNGYFPSLTNTTLGREKGQCPETCMMWEVFFNKYREPVKHRAALKSEHLI